MRNYKAKETAVLVDSRKFQEDQWASQVKEHFGLTDDEEISTYVKALKERIISEAYSEAVSMGMPKAMAKNYAHDSVESNPFDILTNTSGYFGAISLLDEDFMDSVCEKYGDELIIIPQSIDQVLVVNGTEECDLASLKFAVLAANHADTESDRVLSYNLYSYDRATKKISVKEVA